jgi:hypothetical protein
MIAADSRIAFLTRPPPDMRAVDSQIAKSARESEAMMERLYRDHPEMRPSKASIAAQALRDQADRIEQQDTKDMLATIVAAQVTRLNACKPIAALRAAAAR